MERVKTGLRRTKLRIKRWFSQDRIGFLIAAIVCLAWTWGAVSSASRNWQLEQRLGNKRRELRLLQLEIDTIELENQYYASEEYQELAAREKQNKIIDGESLVYLPDNSDYAKHKNNIIQPEIKDAPEEKTNFEQWISFILGG
ncbi:hypothetical protein IJG79_00725 [Candidatus Saccharibacteria bacterium]|nr:hypothetical protein [Candidatus Saccharibacteria bacterium]